MRKNVSAAQQEWPEALKDIEEAEQELLDLPKFRIITKLTCPAAGAFVAKQGQLLAYLRTAQTALAVERFRTSRETCQKI